MGRIRMACRVFCLLLAVAILGMIAGQPIALAVSKTLVDSPSAFLGQASSTEDKIELICKYPVLEASAGVPYAFAVDLKYTGSEARLFDLSAVGPPGWGLSIQTSYEPKQISAIRLDAAKAYPETINIILTPSIWRPPDPGEYTITVEASSEDEVKGSIDLMAIVTVKPQFSVDTAEGRLNMEALAGDDNHVSILVSNTGSAVLNEVTFTSEKPKGWRVTFDPDKLESLSPGVIREVDVIVKPPPKTIAGDYMVSLRFDSQPVTYVPDLRLRVTVLTPTIWGWVGIGIVVIVIAGLAVMFMRLGRR